MSLLASFLTVLWVSSATAQLGLITDLTLVVFIEVQGLAGPLGKPVGLVGGTVCKAKPLLGVSYDSYEGEPDMSKLTLVFQTSTKTVIYNLTEAPTEIPKETWFDKNDLLKIFVHGFLDNPTGNSFQTINHAFATQGIVNILALDASSLIGSFYLRASTLVRFIGEKLGAVLAALVQLSNLDPANIHLIGHSLGSHICGFAGKKFLELTGYLLARISGLDPAGPCFALLEAALRLSEHDASFVDVTNTNAGVYGINELVGHVQFCPNGGTEQPNCLLQADSHSLVWEYYAESIINCTSFIAVKCESYEKFRNGLCENTVLSVMGYCTATTIRGTYFLQTNGKRPYGRGQLGLTYKNDVGLLRNVKDILSDTL